ncbi:hypothetical protein PFISCL1PPCAC_7327, partial [Pristionchus fissidentatus]
DRDDEVPKRSWKKSLGVWYIKTTPGYYLQPRGSDVIPSTPSMKKAWWNIMLYGDGKVSIKSQTGRFLCAHANGHVSLEKHYLECELWTPGAIDDGSWTYTSYNGRFLSVGNGEVTTIPHNLAWEHFWLEKVGQGSE